MFSTALPASSNLSRITRAVRSPDQWIRRRKRQIELEGMLAIGQNSGLPMFPGQMLVGTFHKSGTVLMASVFRQLSRLTGLPIWDSDRMQTAPQTWQLCLRFHSDFDKAGLDPAAYPTVVVVRDPRDMVLSAMRYHRKSTEPWLHAPDFLGTGRTYQDTINALPDDRARMIFEMDEASGRELRRMNHIASAPEHADTLFLKLEDLVGDRSMLPFQQMFLHQKINPAYLPLAMTVAFRNSLFNPDMPRKKHVNSGGRQQLWRSTYDDALLAAFDSRFPGLVAKLGYDTE